MRVCLYLAAAALSCIGCVAVDCRFAGRHTDSSLCPSARCLEGVTLFAGEDFSLQAQDNDREMKSTECAAWWLFVTFSSTIVINGANLGSGVRKCPDGRNCGPETSCTPVSPGGDSYGCCPYDGGVPCLYKSDTAGATPKHGCCPHGHRCLQGTCVGDEGGVSSSYAPVALLPPLRRKLRSTTCRPKETVECQDHTTCPAGNSCCHTPEYPVGTYSCCPYEYGQVCCPDGSCCAAGYRCEPRWGVCMPTLQQAQRAPNGTGSASSRRLPVPARRGPQAKSPGRTSDAPWIPCPDGTYCHRNSTCCSVRSSEPSEAGRNYACCPHEGAQCCVDGEHCCPRGTRCEHFDQQAGHRCRSLNDERGRTVLASKKYPSLDNVPSDTYPSVPCPTWMVCSSGTCCRDQYGAYRCSPYPGGVCCASGISGCPPGTECVG
ncbi:progranulin-like isoform X3 [Dermacentor silvarum]|uniref:progranulin-like isoform X3 n=1 Tax=Dermacentor silvarum TaxID=543639 RepID=UPI002100E1E6|nr:progranulin-like isoform X3 [Dermacentor silvarum]